MEFARRALLNAAITLAAACATESATSACSLSAPVRPKRFDDFACRKQIVELVDMLNRGVVIEEAEIDAWLEERPIVFDEDLLWSGEETMSPAAFIKNFKISDGKLDSKPIRISELSLIKNRRNFAAYAFTMRRYSYTAADEEGCNGLFVHDEYWSYQLVGYIASFTNNRMESLRAFPEWFADA